MTAATIVPAALAATLATRLDLPAGFVAERTDAIVAGMHRTPLNYDPAAGRLTEAGAALVEQILRTDTWGREVQQWVDEHRAKDGRRPRILAPTGA
jgi:hypothetical protein